MGASRTHALVAVGVMFALPPFVLSACGGSTSPQVEEAVDSGSPTVTSADPDSGTRKFTLDVRVLGSGYDRGSRAIWALNSDTAFATTKVRTNSTRYVSSNELVANITISSDALEARYDVVVVTSSGKKNTGVGMFAVRNTRYFLTFQGGLRSGNTVFSAVGKTGDPFSGIAGSGVLLTIPDQALGPTAICDADGSGLGTTTSAWGEYAGDWIGGFSMVKPGPNHLWLSFFASRADGSPGVLNMDIHTAYTETNSGGVITLTAGPWRALVGARSTPRGAGFDAVDRCISFDVKATP